MYEQKVRTMNIDELVGLMKSNRHYVLVDARSRSDYDDRHLPGALSIPVEDIKDYADKLDKDEEIVTYCGSYQCPASTMAAKELMNLGFKNVRDYKGGIKEWGEKGYPVESSKQA
jgi:rhodanese-related sulfurtransferase